MKLAYALALLAGCAGASSSPSSEAPTGGSTTTPADTNGAVTAARSTSSTITATTAPQGSYSCFNYMSGGTKRYGCSRTAECDDYLSQARAVGGLRDLSGCATVEAVFCFHQAPSQTDAEGSDVCQPTLELCASERAALVRAGQSADTDCARR